jgi:hypothetical protein
VRRIKQATIRNVVLILSFASFASATLAQDNQSKAQSQSQTQSLGDAARQARAARASAPKSATVVDDDNLPESKGGLRGGGKLSPDKQAFCDEVRQRKDPAAEQACAVLAIDMGLEYESMTARYVDVEKSVCAANGSHLPKSDPKNPSLAAQQRELGEISTKFAAMMEAEMKTVSISEAALNALRMEKYREEYAQVTGLRNNGDLEANPEEKQRFLEIEEKYRSREQEKEAVAAQERARGLRYVYDTARLQELCERH